MIEKLHRCINAIWTHNDSQSYTRSFVEHNEQKTHVKSQFELPKTRQGKEISNRASARYGNLSNWDVIMP